MRKILVSAAMVVLLTTVMSSLVSASAPVSFTWAAADLGQGCWGGGPLYADHTAGGGAACSLQNGQVVAKLQPTGWAGPSAGVVTIFFNVVAIKGTLPFPVSPFPLPITGTPVIVGGTLFRVTPVQ